MGVPIIMKGSPIYCENRDLGDPRILRKWGPGSPFSHDNGYTGSRIWGSPFSYDTGSVADNRKVKPPKKLKDEHYRFIDECMADDDELTATQVHAMLKEKYLALIVSVSTVKRACMELGWMAKKTRYGAMISESNQEKRVE